MTTTASQGIAAATGSVSEKACTSCGLVKPLSAFWRDKTKASGYGPRCKPCIQARRDNPEFVAKNIHYLRQYREVNRDRLLAYREGNKGQVGARRAAQRAADPLQNRIHGGATRARRLGREVEKFDSLDLELFWLCNGIDPDRCFYCSDPFESLDHATPLSRGGDHTLENIVPCCATCNSAKKRAMTATEYIEARNGL